MDEYNELMGDYAIKDGKRGFYELYQYNKLVDVGHDWDAIFIFMRQHMDEEGIYPNVFYQSESGSIDQYDYNGNLLTFQTI